LGRDFRGLWGNLGGLRGDIRSTDALPFGRLGGGFLLLTPRIDPLQADPLTGGLDKLGDTFLETVAA
jgi:hypothetical protein